MVKTTFFLGAGFSRPADMPTMGEFKGFADLYDTMLRNEHIEKKTTRTKSAKIHREKMDVYFKFVKYCENIKNSGNAHLKNIEPYNMEDIFMLAEMLKRCGVERINIGDIDLGVDDVYEGLLWTLYRVYTRIPPHNPANNNLSVSEVDWNVYKKVAQFACNKKNNVDIITTNYDMIAEYMFNAEGCMVYYPSGIPSFCS